MAGGGFLTGGIGLEQAAALVLVVSRVLGLVATASVCFGGIADWRLKLSLALALSVVVVPLVSPQLSASGLPSGGELVLGLAGEFCAGAALGLVMGLVVAGARLAGEIVGAQAGLMPAAILTGGPEEGESMNALGHFYGLIAVACFLLLDGPLHLSNALIESYEVIPALGGGASGEVVADIASRLQWSLGLALQAAAPAAVAVAVAGVGVTLLARSAAGMGILSLSFPARWVVSMLVVMVTLGPLSLVFLKGWRVILGLESGGG